MATTGNAPYNDVSPHTGTFLSSYMHYAFPHDELKPLSGSWTDSLQELGNARTVVWSWYDGVALTLIDSLDTLAVVGNKTEFTRGVNWIVDNVSFDLDLRVHLFETNIRVLGGLLSGHLLALDMIDDYESGLLDLAYDLGKYIYSC